MIHGRFQPFHIGHLEYLQGAAARATRSGSGSRIPTRRGCEPEPSDPLRHLPESNPYTYAERLLMVKAAAAETVDVDVHVIPFPVNEPELWHAYVPDGVTQFIRHFSDWGSTKIDRLRAAGYDVVVLDEGAEKEISGVDVRTAMREGRAWQPLVPAGVARVIESLGREPELTRS